MAFEAGNKLAKGGRRAGAGRKPGAARETASAALDGITQADLSAIVREAVARARDGDSRARDFVFDRLLGKPASADVAAVEALVRAEAARFQEAVLEALTDAQKQDVLARLRKPV